MKIFIFLLTILFAFNANAQYLNGIKINPDQSKSKQYIPISVNGKELLTNKNKPLKQYDLKGSYNGILLTDFAVSLSDYIVDQGLISSGGFFVSSAATAETIQDADGTDFLLTNVGFYSLSSNIGMIFGDNYSSNINQLEIGGSQNEIELYSETGDIILTGYAIDGSASTSLTLGEDLASINSHGYSEVNSDNTITLNTPDSILLQADTTIVGGYLKVLGGSNVGGGLPYQVYTALLSDPLAADTIITFTALPLIIGETYTIGIYVPGDDFSNIANVIDGDINTNGCVFIATGTTPTNWTNGTSLSYRGTPDINVLQNTLLKDIAWKYNNSGEWKVFLKDGFDITKTFFSGTGNYSAPEILFNMYDANSVYFLTQDSGGSSVTSWSGDGPIYIEIRVYP